MPKAKKVAAPPPASRHKWLFRIAALVIIPLAILAALEAGLRLAGYGHHTGVFDKVQLGGKDYLLNNEDFGLNFFPPELCQWILPQKIEAEKPPGTCRIFVFGESAAQGDPEPAFGASRYLEALLRDRYPGTRFEVVNLGMVAISSHVVLPIARDCIDDQGDLWIIYMGNNEMIGPYGASSVFGAKALPWPLARLSIALQRTHLGQLVTDLSRRMNKKNAHPVWGGMEMFLGNELAPDDPAREVVYKNYQRNLQDIIGAARQADAHILLSTVAVNLKDCPPFASVLSKSLGQPDRDKFNQLLTSGRTAQTNSDWKTAAADYDQAVALDSTMAEAQFREGQCLWQLNDLTNAARHFQSACDDDALDFRADSRINGMIRDTAQQMAGPDLALCDAAASLPEPGAIAGSETFYEHVHLNFDGNYRLGLLWAKAAERLLPESVKDKARGDWASQEICEERLGLTDWGRADVFNQALLRMKSPPLSTQFNNDQRMAELTARLDNFYAQRNTNTAAVAVRIYEDAISRSPEDHWLHEHFASFLQLIQDYPQAATEWKYAQELMPRNEFASLSEGECLVNMQQFDSARKCFRQALELYPRFVDAWRDLGNLDAVEGKQADALTNYQHALECQPNDPQTFLFRAEALGKLNQTNEAVADLRRAVKLSPDYWQAHYALAGFLSNPGHDDEARDEYATVVRLQPGFVQGRLYLGAALYKHNDYGGARQQFAEALRLDPDNKTAKSYLAALARQ
jgi:tetratricopeptide (TPR) repeat protein